MSERETSMGGGVGAFPSTSWTELAHLGREGGVQGRELLGRLLLDYWRPIYLTLRHAWGRSVEDAKDLTQEFLSRLLDEDFAAQMTPEQGRFRDWIKASLKHFMLNYKRDQAALKRGGNVAFLSLERLVEPDHWVPPTGAAGEDPAVVFDRAWARELLSRAVDGLQSELLARGKAPTFEAFRLHYLETSSEHPLTYREIADRIGVSVFDVGNYLKEARAVLREVVTRLVGVYARSAEEVEAELSELLGNQG